MKATYKRRALGDVSSIFGAARSISAAARAAGISRKTAHEWIRAGHVPRPGGQAPRRPAATAADARTPATWRRWVLKTYELDGTERQLLELACEALAMARDPDAKPAARLMAAARFAALIKQLDLESAHHGEAEMEAASGPTIHRVK